jgi:hypothetical protein
MTNWRQLDSLGELTVYAVYEGNKSSFVSMPNNTEGSQVNEIRETRDERTNIPSSSRTGLSSFKYAWY